MPPSSSNNDFAIVCYLHILFYFECPQNPSYISSTERRIYVYDPNFSQNGNRYIKLTTNSSGSITSWYYKVNDLYNWGTGYSNAGISYIPYVYYLAEWNGRGNLKTRAASTAAAEMQSAQEDVDFIAVNSKKFSIYRIDEDETGEDLVETKVASYDETSKLVTDEEDIFLIPSTNYDCEEEYIKLYVPADELYIIKNEDTTLQDDFQANIANVNTCASVSTSSSKVSLSAFDGDDTINGYTAASIMDAPAGTTYSIEIRSSLDQDGELDRYRSAGTVKNASETPGVALSGSTITNLCANASVSMSGDLEIENTFVITASSESGGTISPSGDTYIGKNDTASYTISPGAGCLISQIIVDGEVLPLTEKEKAGDYIYKFENVTANHTIYAAFEPAFTDSPEDLTVSSDENGMVYLKWSAVDKAENYRIYRKQEGEKWSSKPIAQVSGSVLTYKDTQLRENNTDGTYIYAVTAVRTVTGGSVESRKSELVKVNYKRILTDISTCSISLSGKTYTYNGSKKKPVVTVMDGTKKLSSKTDYKVSYKNNVNAGTATVTITGRDGDYCGTKKVTFKINPQSITNFTFTKVSSKTYTGKAVKPTVTVKNGSVTLKCGNGDKDYTVSYKNNTAIGKATITIKGTNNYSGTKTITFTINPQKVTNVKAVSTGYNSIKLTWSKVSNASGYKIYRSVDNKTFSCIKTIKGNSTVSFTDSKRTSGKTYYYKIKAYKTTGTKTIVTYTSDYSSLVKAKPVPSTAVINSVKNLSGKKVQLKWNKVAGASGYVIYRAASKTGKYTLVKNITSGSTLTYTNTGLTKGKTYYYKIKAYRIVDGKKVYGSLSSVKGVSIRK